MSHKASLPLLLIATSIFSITAHADMIWPMSNSKITSTSEKIGKNIILKTYIPSILGKSKDNKNFEKLEINNYAQSRDLFQPILPYNAFLISGDDPKLKISKGKKVILSGITGRALSTYQGEKCRCNNLIDQTTDSFKTRKISKRPGVLKTYLGDFRGQDIYKIEISPIEFKGNEVAVFPDLKVEISGKQDVSFFDLKSTDLAKKMLIVLPPLFQNEIKPFIDFKKSLGFEVTTLEVNQSSTFNEIKNEIHKIAREKNISYLLIVGSEKLIATQYVPTNFEKNTPSDLEFTTLGGDGDLIPDLFSARISINLPQDLNSWVEKTIKYETTAKNAKLKTIALASNEGANPSDVEYVKSMVAPLTDKFNVSTQYFFQGESNSNAANISTAVDGGVDFINYIGHGSGFSWPSLHTGQYSSDNLKDLRNANRFPIVIDVACQNGRFQGEERFGESFVTGVHDRLAGAVAYYGGSVDISWDPPAIMAIGISQGLDKDKENILGPSLLKGQMYLLKNYSDQGQVRYNFIWYHLQGDPSLIMNF